MERYHLTPCCYLTYVVPAAFHFRAAVMEHHLPRELAEAKALAETVRLMKTERIKKGEEFMERSNDRY